MKIVTYVGVELTNETREVVVFEEKREKGVREFEGVEDDETVVRWTPLDKVIGVWFVNHVVCLHNERCDHVVLLHPHLTKTRTRTITHTITEIGLLVTLFY